MNATRAEMKTLVIIPAYNEAHALPRVLAEIRAELGSVHVVVVDDQSADETASVARREGALVLHHPVNLGYGAAIQTGTKYALRNGYEIVVWMDGDGQHRATDARNLIEMVASGQCDVCIGSRFGNVHSYRMPWARRTGSRLFSFLVRVLIRRTIRDVTSGFQALSAPAARLCTTELFPTEYPDANLILLYHCHGLVIGEVSVNMRKDETGKSMHSGIGALFYPYHMLVSLFTIFLTFLFSARRRYE